MVQNPFSQGLSVEINSDTSGLTGGLDNAMAKIGDMKKAVGGLSVVLGGLAAGGIAKSIESAANFEDQLADLEKVTSADLVEPLKRGIMDLSEEIPMSRKGLVELATQAGKFGAESEKEIMGFVENVGKISSATDLTADEAGKRFAKIAGAVGRPMDEVGELGNAVNILADSMKTDAGEITDTATRAANTLSQQLGIGEDAVLAMSASMNEVSPSSRRAASSLRRAAESLMDPKKVEDIAGALGMSTDEFRTMREEDPQGLMDLVARKMAEGGDTATELRGILGKAATDFSKLGGQLEATEEAQGLANEQFEEGTSLQREMDIRTGTLQGQMQLLQNRIQNVATRIGDAFLPVIKRVVARLTPLLEGFADWIETLSETEIVIGSTVGTIALLGVGLAALVGGPITLAIGAVAALAAAFATDFMGIRTAVENAISFITGLFQDNRAEMGRLRQKVDTAIAGMQEAFRIAKQVAREVFEQFLQPLLARLSALFEEHFDDILREVVETFDVLMSRVQTFASAFNKFWSEWGDEILTVAKFVWDLISNTIEFTLDFILTTIRVVLNLIQGDWEEAWEAIEGFLRRTLDRSLDFATKWGGKLLDWLGGLVDDVIQWFKSLASDLIGGSIIPEMLSSILSAVKSWSIVDVFGDVLRSVKQTVGNIVDGIISTVRGALDTVGNIADRVSSTVSDIQGAVDSAQDAASSIASTAGDVIGGAVDTATGGGGSDNTLPGVNFGLPSFQSGGLVGRSGLAMVHEGERVVPASKAAEAGTTVHIDRIVASGPEEGQAAARALKQELRSSNF